MKPTALANLAVGVSGGLLLLFALEAVICLAMAAPLALRLRRWFETQGSGSPSSRSRRR